MQPHQVNSPTPHRNPTALDAFAFAYLHSLLHSADIIRIEVARHENLVTWEQKVRTQVEGAFTTA
jgi:metaxin